MTDSRSPEEKLLGLIRNDRDHGSASSDGAEAAGARLKAFGKGLFFFPFARVRALNVDVRKVRAFLFMTACLYFFVTLTYPLWATRNVASPSPDTRSLPAPDIGTQTNAPSLETYLEGVRRHPIFGQAADGDAGPLPAPVSSWNDDFVLTGVIFDADPQAIVEDKRTQQISYLRKGQSWNGFIVRDVREDTLVLDRSGESFELHM